MKQKLSLQDFFKAIDRKLNKIPEDKIYKVRIELFGKILEFKSPNKEIIDLMANSLTGKITKKKGPADAVFWHVVDKITNYLSEEDAGKRFQYQVGEDFLVLKANLSLLGADAQHKNYYYIDNSGAISIYGFTCLLYRYAKREGYLLLHGAVVGMSGTGVIVAARGGSGKSTFSVSCLLKGLDFVADDYFLLSDSGPLKAYPLYTLIKLNPDMHEKLKIDLPIFYIETKTGKKMMDASKLSFCPELDIKGIVFPKVADVEAPEIHATTKATGLMELAFSTAMQLEQIEEGKAANHILKRVTGLPMYELSLSKDLDKNVEVFKDFLEQLNTEKKKEKKDKAISE